MPDLSQFETSNLEMAVAIANRDSARYRLLRDAIRAFLDWHGYDNAEGLADALAQAEAIK
jgi:hypothetical protein